MEFCETKLNGAWVVALEPNTDDRGFFARSFCEREFGEVGLCTRFVQSNISYNLRAGTLRGMHWQASPHGEVKLVRCTAGAVHDVIVDLRAGSPTRLQWFDIELSSENRLALYIPEGFAHGFLTLRDGSEVHYEMGSAYVPAAARGMRWNDPAIGISWPSDPVVISDRDRAYPDVDPATLAEEVT
jgi:dTDP-4-dehydrorhamnose 3,5-epimerase